jgi:hypothetical protein
MICNQCSLEVTNTTSAAAVPRVLLCSRVALSNSDNPWGTRSRPLRELCSSTLFYKSQCPLALPRRLCFNFQKDISGLCCLCQACRITYLDNQPTGFACIRKSAHRRYANCETTSLETSRHAYPCGGPFLPIAYLGKPSEGKRLSLTSPLRISRAQSTVLTHPSCRS